MLKGERAALQHKTIVALEAAEPELERARIGGMKSLSRKVDSFDGQTITVDGKPCYELGGFLGGGAAGVVYEVGCSGDAS